MKIKALEMAGLEAMVVDLVDENNKKYGNMERKYGSL